MKTHEQKLEERRQYYYKNKEKMLEYKQQRRATKDGYKSEMKSKWKKRGLDLHNFEEVFEDYYNATNCMFCDCEFSKENLGHKKCLHHDHSNGEAIAVICNSCNLSAEGKSGQKYIYETSLTSKGCVYEYWTIDCRKMKFMKRYNKKKYSLEDVIEIRNKILYNE